MNSFLLKWLPQELVELINKILFTLYFKDHKEKMYYPLKEIKKPIFVILNNSYRGLGLIFGGAKDTEMGKKCGYGIFIKDVYPDSINIDLKHKLKNMQIVKMENVDLTKGTFNDLKRELINIYYINSEWVVLILKYNHKLVSNYNTVDNSIDN